MAFFFGTFDSLPVHYFTMKFWWRIGSISILIFMGILLYCLSTYLNVASPPLLLSKSQGRRNGLVEDMQPCPDKLVFSGLRSVTHTLDILTNISMEHREPNDALNSLLNLPSKSEEFLQVLVLPHSHNDPAWLQTFEEYYRTATSHILDQSLKFLMWHPNVTFLWTEMVSFSHWWHNLTTSEQANVRHLILEGRLELSGGGWVMPDESLTTMYGLLDNQITGRWWLQRLDVRLTHSNIAWSIDAFGHSSLNGLYLPKLGYIGQVINRVPTPIKHQLRLQQRVEWRWIPPWGGMTRAPGLLTSMLPFQSYNIKFSCGPDVTFCDQIDFTGTEMNKPHDIPQLAEHLVQQLRLKSRLYRHPVVLMPLGDDFRYQSEAEWQSQYKNYRSIFQYINSKRELKMQIEFGTLSQYFKLVQRHVASVQVPFIAGDFFPYQDQEHPTEAYWSGYYSSRPRLKRHIRELESWLRCAEILTSLSALNGYKMPEPHMKVLEAVRRTFAFLQHHDAITGTSVDHVVRSYMEHMDQAEEQLKSILVSNLEPLLGAGRASLEVLDSIDVARSVPLGRGEHPVTVFNPDNRLSERCIHLTSSTQTVATSAEQMNIPCQVNPIFTKSNRISSELFDVLICLSIPALSSLSFKVEIGGRSGCPVAKLRTTVRQASTNSWIIEPWHQTPTFSVTNEVLNVTFDTRRASPTTLRLPFREVRLQCRTELYDSHRGGAYLFQTLGHPSYTNFHPRPAMFHWEGPLFAGVRVAQTAFNITFGVYKGRNSPHLQRGLQVTHEVDLTNPEFDYSNTEMMWKCDTSLKNLNGTFFTDANGFHLQERRYRAQVPLGGNIYPVTSMAVLEDSQSRLSLVSDTPLGFTSTAPGELQAFLQRINRIDDQRGNTEGIPSDPPATVRHVLILDSTSPQPNHLPPQQETHARSLPLLAAQQSRDNAFHFHIFRHSSEIFKSPTFHTYFHFPEDIEILNMRLFPTGKELLLILMRRPVSQYGGNCAQSTPTADLILPLTEVFSDELRRKLTAVGETTLDGLTTLRTLNLQTDNILFPVADIMAFVIAFSN